MFFKKKKKNFKNLLLISNFLFVVLGIFYFRDFNFEILKEFDFLILFKVIILIFFFSYFRAVRLGLIFDAYGVNFNILQLFYISVVSQSYSLLTPGRVGEIYFIQYLKNRKINNKIFLFIISKFFEGILLLSLLIFFLISLYLELNINNNYEFLLILFFFLFFFNTFIYKLFDFVITTFFINKIPLNKEIINQIKSRYLKINFFSVTSWLILFYSVNILLEKNLNLAKLFNYSFLNQISVSVPLSFMGVGVRDILFFSFNENLINISHIDISFTFLFVYFLIISLGLVIFSLNFLFSIFFKKKKH